MAKSTGRRVPCNQREREGRLEKAKQFAHAAETLGVLDADEPALIDARVTLWVLTGIAASDVICCALLGEHAQGDGHDEAVPLLRSVRPELARHLEVLIQAKTRSGYSAQASSTGTLKKTERSGSALLAHAEQIA